MITAARVIQLPSLVILLFGRVGNAAVVCVGLLNNGYKPCELKLLPLSATEFDRYIEADLH